MGGQIRVCRKRTHPAGKASMMYDEKFQYDISQFYLKCGKTYKIPFIT
jgi:hypothetical protein